ncbi:MAG: biotin/lipoyl-binding protein [Ruminococcus sp.]|nr:biotin/lipoyl-binding protein [Ruminococcus sp.]
MKEISKARTAKYFIMFLAVMLVLTFVSRMMYAGRMARVSVASIKTQALMHTVNASGVLEPVKKTAIFTPDGLRVAEVCVNTGDSISEGDTVLRLDTGFINEKIADLDTEISYDLRSAGDTYNNSKSVPVFTEAGLRVSEVRVKVGDPVESGQVLICLDTWHLENYLMDLQNQINNNICQRDSYVETEDKHNVQAMNNTIDEQQRKYERYYNIMASGGIICSRSSGIVTDIIESGAVTDDSAVALVSDDTQLSYSVVEKKQRLEKLRALSENEGYIKSQVSGVVSDISLKVGDVTSETASMTIADISEGFIFRAGITETDTKYVSAGDTVSLSFKNGKKKVENCIVKQLVKNDGEEGYSVEVPLEDTELSIGEIGRLSTSVLSETVCETVPLSAVTMMNDTNGYMYIVEESEGFLGKEHSVRKVQVRVEDRNDNYLGLADLGLDSKTKVVVSSSKKLNDSQKVRI